MTEFELALVHHVVCNHPRKDVYLEIGSAKGGSFLFFAALLNPAATAISVDVGRDPSLERAAGELTTKGYQISLITGNSRSPATVAEVRKVLNGRQVDVLFIDGDHSYFGCASDARNYAPLVRTGGLIIFHDCGAFSPALPGAGNRNVANVGPIFDALAYGKKTIRVQEYAGIGIIFA